MKLRLRKRVHRATVPLRTFLAKKGVFLSKNDRGLWALRNKHEGETAVVIGMGPSLKAEDLECFRNHVTFACNKIFLAFENTDWRPDYYSVADVLVAENNRELIKGVKGPIKIFPERLRSTLPKMEDALFFQNYFRKGSSSCSPSYTSNPLEGIISGGATVLIPLIQAAYWMGFAKVFVVGVDFSFQVSPKSDQLSKDGEDVLINSTENNHFHKDYRQPGETWTAPRMEEQEAAFEFARKAFESEGRELINASRRSKLTQLPRVEFETVFSSSSEV